MPKIQVPTVDCFLDTLEHAQKAAILRLREVSLAVDPRITEEITWNAPRSRIDEVQRCRRRRVPTRRRHSGDFAVDRLLMTCN